MHHQSKFRPNRSMRCGDKVISRFFNMITVDHLVLRITVRILPTSALMVHKFRSAFYTWPQLDNTQIICTLLQSNPMSSDGRRNSSMPVSYDHTFKYKLVDLQFWSGQR